MRRSKRSLFIDIDDLVPKRGDFLQAVGKKGLGSAYLIGIVRKVKRKDLNARSRYTLKVWRVDEIPEGSRVIEFAWYPRKKKRLTFEQYMKRQLPAK